MVDFPMEHLKTSDDFQEESGREMAVLFGLLAAFLVVNIVTASWYPIVWLDEVQYVDPAVNLALGNGFTSSAWERPRDELWAMNTPLYQLLLAGWLSIVGFSLTAVRSFNYFVMAALVAGVWWSVVRLRLLKSASSRIVLVLLLLLGDGVTFTYRGGRPDCVSMIPFLLFLLAYSMPNPLWRRGLCVLAGCLMPLAGIQLLAYFAVFGLVLLLFLRRQILKVFVFAAIGILVGLALMLSVYQALGLVGVFTAYTMRSSHGILPEIVELVTRLEFAPFLDKLSKRLNGPYRDWSCALLVIATYVLFLVQWLRDRMRFRSPLTAAAVISLSISYGVSFLGKYPTYYSWMTFFPLSISFLMALKELGTEALADRLLQWFAGLMVAIALLAGLPLQLFIAFLDRDVRDYAVVERLVQENVSRDDWLYCDHACYYAAKPLTPHLFLSSYGPALSPEEMERITAVILRHDAVYTWEDLPPPLAGDWAPTDVKPASDRPGRRWFRRWYYVDYNSLRVFRKQGRQ